MMFVFIVMYGKSTIIFQSTKIYYKKNTPTINEEVFDMGIEFLT